MFIETKTTKPILEKLDTKIEQESFCTYNANQSEQKSIVIASFNIRYAVGSFLISGGLLRKVGISRPSRRTKLVMNNIETAARTFTENSKFPKPDIIALQESDKETLRAGNLHVARELAHQIKYNYAHTSLGLPREYEPQTKQWYLDFEEPIKRNDKGETGLAFLSNHNLHDLKRLDLPWFDCPWRPRIAIATTIEVGNRKVRIFNTHIDPHASVKEQHEQHEVILQQADKDNLPTILLGDFNTLTPDARKQTRKFLNARGYQTPFKSFTSTWRAGLYRNHTDWIFMRGLKSLRHGVIKSLKISDHYPIWTEIDLND